MAQLIDSSVFISLEKSGRPLNDLLQSVSDEPTALAGITASELLIGAIRASPVERQMRRESLIEAILQAIPVLPFDLVVARTHAIIWAELAGAGRIIGDRDMIIAATALTYGYAVLTKNIREFGRVPGLEVREPAW